MLFVALFLVLLVAASAFRYSPIQRKLVTRHHTGMSKADSETTILPPAIEQNIGLQIETSAAPQLPAWMQSMKDYAVLLVVPVVWGSYSPLIKGIYGASNIVAPPPIVFNLFSYIMSLSALTTARLISDKSPTNANSNPNPVFTKLEASQGIETRVGLELGMWLFLGSTIQIIGIQSTTAIKSAIIVQLTTVIVPILESLLVTKKPISQRLWVSCILALMGVVICSFDGAILESGAGIIAHTFDLSSVGQILSANLQLNTGDFLVGLSAVFYSMHVVRLGKFAVKADPIKLAQMKSFTGLTATTGLILGICAFGGDSMNNLKAFSEYLMTTIPAAATTGQYYVALAVLWNGFFATALATWAMSLGQKSVSSTLANILYSSQPIWAAIFALALLGESVSTTTVLGSSVLLAAIIISLLEPSANNSKD